MLLISARYNLELSRLPRAALNIHHPLLWFNMDNGAYSFLELRRNLQSPTSFQPALKNSSLDGLRSRGTPSRVNASAKSNPPLRKLNQDTENRKPLFNLLYGAQDKPKAGSQAGTGTPQRKPYKAKGAECVDGTELEHTEHPTFMFLL